ncbi:hypothetical protein FED44_00815, partial [Microbispora fusca]
MSPNSAGPTPPGRRGTLVHRLVAEGHEVMALARSGPSIQRVRAAGAEPVPGDLAELGRADSPGPTWLA